MESTPEKLPQKEKKSPPTQEELFEEVNHSFLGMRSVPRRSSLIATFENGLAVGWKFKVYEAFKDALDIKFTPITVYKQTYNSWTQGHAFAFHEGDALYSHDHHTRDSFLQQNGAVVLQVLSALPAGFETNKKLTGTFAGDYYRNKNTARPNALVESEINISTQSYDSGLLSVAIFKVNKEKTGIERDNVISISQVDFVALLQHGFYWEKPENKNDKTPIQKIVLVA
jgi:hypothetical protein